MIFLVANEAKKNTDLGAFVALCEFLIANEKLETPPKEKYYIDGICGSLFTMSKSTETRQFWRKLQTLPNRKYHQEKTGALFSLLLKGFTRQNLPLKQGCSKSFTLNFLKKFLDFWQFITKGWPQVTINWTTCQKLGKYWWKMRVTTFGIVDHCFSFSLKFFSRFSPIFNFSPAFYKFMN